MTVDQLGHPRRVLAAAMGLFFLRMAVWPERFTSGTFSVCYELAGPRTWGTVLAVLFAVVFAVRNVVANLAVVAAMSAWSAGLILADIDGRSESPAGWTIPVAIALLFAWGHRQPSAP